MYLTKEQKHAVNSACSRRSSRITRADRLYAILCQDSSKGKASLSSRSRRSRGALWVTTIRSRRQPPGLPGRILRICETALRDRHCCHDKPAHPVPFSIMRSNESFSKLKSCASIASHLTDGARLRFCMGLPHAFRRGWLPSGNHESR